MDDRPRFDSEFFLGIPEVDQEHHQLFEIVGEIYDSLGSDEATAKSAARTAVARLLQSQRPISRKRNN